MAGGDVTKAASVKAVQHRTRFVHMSHPTSGSSSPIALKHASEYILAGPRVWYSGCRISTHSEPLGSHKVGLAIPSLESRVNSSSRRSMKPD